MSNEWHLQYSASVAQTHQRQRALHQKHREVLRRRQEAEANPPLFSECVVGYRTWCIDPFLRLWPMSQYGDTPWVPGVNVATCGRDRVMGSWHEIGGVPRAPSGHAVPHARCDCGWYSRRRLGQVLSDLKYPQFEKLRYPVVVGAVAVWGDLRVHQDGFRASHATILALADAPKMPSPARDLTERTAKAYGVPFVALDELEAEASRHGSPLPDDVGPEQTDPQWEPGAAAFYASGQMLSMSTANALMWHAPPRPPRPLPSARAAVAAGAGVVAACAGLNFGAVAVLGHRWWVIASYMLCDAAIGWNAASLLRRVAPTSKEETR